MSQKPPDARRGMIRIDPKMQWPILNSDDMDVEEFYEEFEGVCQLANDMKGLLPMERLLALKICLRGSRTETYEIVERQCQENGTFTKDLEGVYEIITSS